MRRAAGEPSVADGSCKVAAEARGAGAGASGPGDIITVMVGEKAAALDVWYRCGDGVAAI